MLASKSGLVAGLYCIACIALFKNKLLVNASYTKRKEVKHRTGNLRYGRKTLVPRFEAAGSLPHIRGVMIDVPGEGSLHCTALHCSALLYTALHCTALHCIVML